jgi:hypothetical protein
MDVTPVSPGFLSGIRVLRNSMSVGMARQFACRAETCAISRPSVTAWAFLTDCDRAEIGKIAT